jgi:hypothetical protein
MLFQAVQGMAEGIKLLHYTLHEIQTQTRKYKTIIEHGIMKADLVQTIPMEYS